MVPETLAEKTEKILIDLKDSTPEVECAVLVDMNGLPMMSVLSGTANDVNIAAMTAGMLGIVKRTVDELEKGKVKRILIQGEKGHIIFNEAGKDAVLTVLTTNEAKLGTILLDSKVAATRIAKILSDRL